MDKTNEKIKIKGLGDGILISIREKNSKEAQSLLFSRINEKPSFFEGARLALDVGECKFGAADLGKLRDELSKRKITFWAMLSTVDETINSAQLLGLETRLGLKKGAGENKQTPTFEGEPAVWIEKTLRSGYRVETKCHVIIIGDVNPGAEIISAGNIFVLGKLHGAVHAGAEGNKLARVYALELIPTQLKIADLPAAPLTGKIKSQSEFACIQGNEIVRKNWTSGKQF